MFTNRPDPHPQQARQRLSLVSFQPCPGRGYWATLSLQPSLGLWELLLGLYAFLWVAVGTQEVGGGPHRPSQQGTGSAPPAGRGIL